MVLAEMKVGEEATPSYVELVSCRKNNVLIQARATV